MRKYKILPGDRFSRLTIIREKEKSGRFRRFECKCDCGNITVVRTSSLFDGTTKSCGCYRNEQNKVAPITHGNSKTRLYSIWNGMRQRCYNPKNRSYQYYGARGILVFDGWMQFKPFMDWALLHGYSTAMTIDRIDCNGNYIPENCRWIPPSLQSKNTRRTRLIHFNGETMCIAEWARKIGMSWAGLKERLKRWPLEKALTR